MPLLLCYTKKEFRIGPAGPFGGTAGLKDKGGFGMSYKPKMTYKGKPLVRKDNELYYGWMTDPYVLYLQILTTAPVDGAEMPDKVQVTLLSTDLSKPVKERTARQSVRHGLYNALDIGSIWLEKALAATR